MGKYIQCTPKIHPNINANTPPCLNLSLSSRKIQCGKEKQRGRLEITGCGQVRGEAQNGGERVVWGGGSGAGKDEEPLGAP